MKSTSRCMNSIQGQSHGSVGCRLAPCVRRHEPLEEVPPQTDTGHRKPCVHPCPGRLHTKHFIKMSRYHVASHLHENLAREKRCSSEYRTNLRSEQLTNLTVQSSILLRPGLLNLANQHFPKVTPRISSLLATFATAVRDNSCTIDDSHLPPR